jgi:hypothetical protein
MTASPAAGRGNRYCTPRQRFNALKLAYTGVCVCVCVCVCVH